MSRRPAAFNRRHKRRSTESYCKRNGLPERCLQNNRYDQRWPSAETRTIEKGLPCENYETIRDTCTSGILDL